MKMSKELEFITRVVKECGQIPLDSNFGKDFNLLWDDEKGILVESFVGEYGYDFTELKEKGDAFVKKLYDELKKDFV